MEYPKEISTLEASSIVISTVIGVGVLPLPLFAVQAGNTAAPLITIMAIGISMIGIIVVSILGIRYPEQTIITYSQNILGKWFGRIFSFLIIIFFAILTSLTSREFGEVVITAVLKETPLEVTVLVMLILAAISTRHDMITFAYIQLFYLPVILGPAILIVILSLKNADILYLLPVWGNAPDMIMMMSGIFTIAALFQGAFVMTIVIPSMSEPKKAMKAGIWGILISGGSYLLIVIATLAVFGPGEISQLLWPTLELARTTSIPGNILQRLDVVFLAIWVVSVFTTLLSSYKLTIHSISQLFGLRDHKMFSYFLLPFVFIIAMIPQNILHMYGVIRLVGRVGLFLTIGYPIFLLIVDTFKRKRRNTYE
jgi:spore germination protein